jgi:hypothetical protein
VRTLNNIVPPDLYASSAELVQADSVRVNLRVTGSAGIYYRIGTGWPDPVYYGDESFLVPGYFSLDRVCTAVSVRQAVPGAGVRATVELLAAGEVS